MPYVPNDKGRRFEFRCECRVVRLAFSAMLMAMIDGITSKVDPGDAMDKNIYDLPLKAATAEHMWRPGRIAQ